MNVGISHDTASFSVESIRRWWRCLGRGRYGGARRLLITADCGGSNGYRLRLWKEELQRLASELCVEILVCHLPPGTSRWKRVEPCLFSFISRNWRGQPLESVATIVTLTGATATGKGLKVYCEVDAHAYARGKNVGKAEPDALPIRREKFHGERNTTLLPRHRPGNR